MADEKRFMVFNRTDGVLAHPELMTRAEAEAFLESFPARFRRQGYYLTASRRRIPAQCVELEIVDRHVASAD